MVRMVCLLNTVLSVISSTYEHLNVCMYVLSCCYSRTDITGHALVQELLHNWPCSSTRTTT